MKALIITALTLFMYVNNSISITTDIQKKNKFTGTYVGTDDDSMFQFKDKDGKITLFDEVNDDVEPNLYDDENIGEKFEVTWEDFKIEITDDEGEGTGEYENGKRIIALKQIE